MKIKNHHQRNKFYIVSAIGLVFLILAISVGIRLYSVSKNTGNPDKETDSTAIIDYGKPTNQQIETGYDAKEDFQEEQEIESVQNIDISISSFSQTNETLSIRTTIDSKDTSGTCELTLSPPSAGSAIVQQVDTQNYGSYSVCKGFDVPVSSLYPGDWTAVVNYNLNGTRSTTKEVITVQ